MLARALPNANAMAGFRSRG